METDEGMRQVYDAAQAFGGIATYDVVTEKESLRQAQQRLELDIDGEVEALRAKPVWSGEDVDTGMGIFAAYRDQAISTGDANLCKDWIELMRSLWHGNAARRTARSRTALNSTKRR